MITLDRLNQLAAQSRSMGDIGDAHADKMRHWCFDPKFKNEQMWWGKDQPYYKFLYLLKKELPGVSLEIGTHRGVGFACTAAGAKASGDLDNHWSIGIDKDSYKTLHQTCEEYDNTTFLHGMSTDGNIIKQVEDICNKVSLPLTMLFIDATHKLAWVNAEIKAYKHLFGDQVVILLDDVIKAANNTHIPLAFSRLPGQKAQYPDLHTDNCIGAVITSKAEYANWDPGNYTHDDFHRGYRLDEASRP